MNYLFIVKRFGFTLLVSGNPFDNVSIPRVKLPIKPYRPRLNSLLGIVRSPNIETPDFTIMNNAKKLKPFIQAIVNSYLRRMFFFFFYLFFHQSSTSSVSSSVQSEHSSMRCLIHLSFLTSPILMSSFSRCFLNNSISCRGV